MVATHEYTPGSPLVIIHSLFDSEDIQQIDRLSEWVKKMHPTQHVCRQFDQAPVEYVNGELVVPATTQNYGGGNDVTHIHGFAQISIPHLLEYIICSASEATMTARWFPHPRQLGIRCVESLLYHAGGKLKLHTDSESIYTIVVMLSEPCAGAFTGGDFVIRESTDRSSDALLRAAPKKGDAIMCVHQLLGPSLAANPVHAAPQLTWGGLLTALTRTFCTASIPFSWESGAYSFSRCVLGPGSAGCREQLTHAVLTLRMGRP
jgi:hypothetical protein